LYSLAAVAENKITSSVFSIEKHRKANPEEYSEAEV
jgi:hypothetical protein